MTDYWPEAKRRASTLMGLCLGRWRHATVSIGRARANDFASLIASSTFKRSRAISRSSRFGNNGESAFNLDGADGGT